MGIGFSKRSGSWHPPTASPGQVDLSRARSGMPSEETTAEMDCCTAWPKARDLNNEDIVVVKGAWNRTLGFKDMMMESVVYRWIQLAPDLYDLLKVNFSEVPHDMYTMIDKSVRALDMQTEVHHRESYTPGFPACVKRDFGDTPAEVMFHYLIMGIQPRHWCLLKDAFLWAMQNNNPYMYQEHDGEDLNKGEDGAVARFFHTHVVAKAHTIFLRHVDALTSPERALIKKQATELQDHPEFGQEFYRRLLTKHPDLIDYFADTDMDYLAKHLHGTLVLVGSAGVKLLDSLKTLSRLGQRHREAMIPTWAYAPVGEVLLETLKEFSKLEESHVDSWVYTYMCCATAISAPMAVEERLVLEAKDFFAQLAKEHDWGAERLEARMKQVGVEVSMTGTYAHTTEELQLGARMAWRNANKCIGRIAWDTLEIRDRRHATAPQDIFEECKEHLKLGANGGLVQSLMTVFAPRRPSEKWGTRFWNSQLCRYAGYRQPDGGVLGDPANVSFTELCINTLGWTPPTERTMFDPLPQVIQAPDGNPMVFDMPRELFVEIPLSHPQHPKFAELGLKWVSIPAITNFNFRLGGVDYPCCPFNGWFVDLEIARNLVERYGLCQKVAAACGFDTSTESSGWRAMAMQATACAVTHSFQKKGVSIIDSYSVSKQFLTHVDREKRCGREVPAQWSWIGGFVGMHCPVWGYEMRDFYLRPQYHYQCDRWLVEGWADGTSREGGTTSAVSGDPAAAMPARVLVLFSSTTGTAERFARKLAAEVGAGYRPVVMDIGSFGEEDARKFTHIVVCVSTFGDGEAPLSSASFQARLPFRLLNAKTGTPIRYAVLALGSSAYPKFCAFGKLVDKALHDAGATPFAKSVLSDETKGHEENFHKFCSAVRVELPAKPMPSGMNEPELTVTMVNSAGCRDTSAEEPHQVRGHLKATVVSSDVVFENSVEDRSTRKIRIDISGCDGMTYTTGGHLSVLPSSPHEEILNLCDTMGISRERVHWKLEAVMDDGFEKYPVDLGGINGISLYEALKWHLDISLRPGTLGAVLGLLKATGGITDAMQAELMADQLATVERFWWVSGLLREFPKAKGKISVAALVTALGKQFPRLYSIASSARVRPSVVEVVVGLVSVGGHRGLASGALHRLHQGCPVWVSTRDSSFRLPDSTGAPLIMAGAGTGVAPFLAFARERAHLLGEEAAPGAAERRAGPALLFVGFRRREEAVSPEVFEDAMATSALTSYSVSLSREPHTARRHLTDALCADAQRVWEALQNPECHYYFCGDGRAADSAYQALLSAAVAGSGTSRVKATIVIDKMRQEGRYHLDVWGAVSHGAAREVKQQKKSNLAKKWLKSAQLSAYANLQEVD